jgi:hypothetical protein
VNAIKCTVTGIHCHRYQIPRRSQPMISANIGRTHEIFYAMDRIDTINIAQNRLSLADQRALFAHAAIDIEDGGKGGQYIFN